MNNRPVISGADLFVLMDREFRRRKPRECSECFVSLPFRVDPAGAGAANWEIVFPPNCGRGCYLILEELVQELHPLYDLRDGD